MTDSSDIYKRDEFLPCRCNTEVVRFSQFRDEGDDWYISVYNYYSKTPSFGKRLKMMWKLLLGKPVVGYEVILSDEDLKKIIKQ